MQYKHTWTPVFLKSRLEIYLSHTDTTLQQWQSLSCSSQTESQEKQGELWFTHSFQLLRGAGSDWNHFRKTDASGQNSHRQQFWNTIFHYTEWHCLHWTCPRWWGTVEWQKVHVFPTQLFLRAPVATASSCDKQVNFRGQTPMLGSVFSQRHPTKCSSAGFKLPLDSTQIPSEFLRAAFWEQTVFTVTSRKRATVSKLSSHLIWKQAKERRFANNPLINY